jgi:hypothetical protein
MRTLYPKVKYLLISHGYGEDAILQLLCYHVGLQL